MGADIALVQGSRRCASVARNGPRDGLRALDAPVSPNTRAVEGVRIWKRKTCVQKGAGRSGVEGCRAEGRIYGDGLTQGRIRGLPLTATTPWKPSNVSYRRRGTGALLNGAGNACGVRAANRGAGRRHRQ